MTPYVDVRRRKARFSFKVLAEYRLYVKRILPILITTAAQIASYKTDTTDEQPKNFSSQCEQNQAQNNVHNTHEILSLLLCSVSPLLRSTFQKFS